MRIGSTFLLAVLLIVPLAGDDSERILTIDHFVRVQSAVPAILGQPAQLYVRERVHAGTLARGARAADRVVLFVHGAGTPAEVAFDTPYQDYSWMGYLAQAGYDAFSVDMTGYGRSTRPAAMNDPCNLAPNQQAALIPRLIPAPCAATYPQALTSIASDWADVGAAVDYIRALRGVERVSLVAWSLGGPRAGGYAVKNPQKVHRLVFLAPGYSRESRAEAPAKVPAEGVVFNTQSRADFDANWERQVGCPAQVEPCTEHHGCGSRFCLLASPFVFRFTFRRAR
jgi:pimeloyl-ACP methyl ester carboxylesterase